VGFRAPASQELALRFLEFLQDRLQLDGMYEDPDLEPTTQPAHLPQRMIDHTLEVLRKVDWSRADVIEFVGRYLSEPKDSVVFTRPSRPLDHNRFARNVLRSGVHLAPATRILFHGRQLFVNGEVTTVDAMAATLMKRLANTRELTANADVPVTLSQLLYGWYLAGYIAAGPINTADE
jgi:50S ribosomal protein L16 3-hydroxylase